MYPRTAQVALSGLPQAQDYLFGRKFGSQSFCRACGVVVFQSLRGPPEHEVRAWPPARQAVYRRNMDLLPLNVRALDGVGDEEWSTLLIDRKDIGTAGYVLD